MDRENGPYSHQCLLYLSCDAFRLRLEMSKPEVGQNSCVRALRRLFCCVTSSEASPQKLDPAQMHSIVLAPSSPQPMETARGAQTQIKWRTEEESVLARETLRLTARSEPGKVCAFTAVLDPSLLKSLEDGADTLRNPMRSYVSELPEASRFSMKPEEESLGEVRRLKYRDLPISGQPPFPLKPITPHGKTRIPTARPRLGLILESLQREETSPPSHTLQTPM